MPIVTLLTDFGTDGPYAGAVRGVLLARCPGVVLADITHEVPPHDVRAGAFLLAAAAPWYPAGTVHLAVVDPGVGTARRPIAAAACGHLFVGPDNGVFSLLLARDPAARVHRIEPARLGLDVISATFHGRDVFAPAAAALAGGAALATLGERVLDPVRFEVAAPRLAADLLHADVLFVDRFGNVTLGVTPADREALFARTGATGLDLEADRARARETPFVATYGDGPAGRPFLLWGSSGWLEAALDRDRADRFLGVRAGDVVRLRLRAPRAT